MTRHSKSNKDGSVFTYYERHRMRHGSEYMRLPGVAIKPWYHCALSLSTPLDPVITPTGILYDRHAIVTHLLKQKEEIAQRQAQRERHEIIQRTNEDRKRQKIQIEQRRQLEQQQYAFNNNNNTSRPSENENIQVTQQPNFWLPGVSRNITTTNNNNNDNNHNNNNDLDNDNDHKQLYLTNSTTNNNAITTPKKKRRRKEDNEKTLCPVNGTPLRLRHLISLKLTKPKQQSKSSIKPVTNDDDDNNNNNNNNSINNTEKQNENSIISNDNNSNTNNDDDDDNTQKKMQRDDNESSSLSASTSESTSPFICPVCLATLTNASKPVALRTGSVLCARCVDAFVRKQGRDPSTGATINLAHDVIVINNCGTAFAASVPDDPASRVAKLYRPSVT